MASLTVDRDFLYPNVKSHFVTILLNRQHCFALVIFRRVPLVIARPIVVFSLFT
jgi:hypothetical protein